MKRILYFFLVFGALALPLWSAGPDRPLRFGILPDSDSMPFMVAEAEGLFAAEGLKAELVLFKSPVERDAAFQAGALDGVISDTIAAALAVQGGFDVRIVSVTDGRYGLVASPGSSSDPAVLRGKPIGLSTNTIIQYLVDLVLENAGVSSKDIVRTAVPKIPVRLELLLGGQTAAAGLPEPFLTVALERGATLVASSETMRLDAGIVLFTKKALDERGEDITRLLKAYWKAAAEINAAPDGYRHFLVDKAGFPEEIRGSYRFVTYRKPVLPGEPEVEAVLEWMRASGLLKTALSPAALLDPRALAGW